MKIFFRFYIVILLLIFSAQSFAEKRHDASLKLERNGINVSIYNYKNSDIAAFEAVTHIKASLDSILAVMFDNTSCAEWIHACDKSFMLEDISFSERYHYQICEIPLPFENRDFVFHSIMKQDPLTKIITITMSAEPNYCHDKQSDECQEVNQSELVRVSESLGIYKLEPDDKGTRLTWIQHTDPSGKLPAWLVNHFLEEVPFNTLQQLALKVKEDKYKMAKLVYDKDGFAIALNTDRQSNEPPEKISQEVAVYSTH